MAAEQRNRLILNFSSLSLIQVISFLLSLIVIPHVLRKVGADGFGVIAVAQVVIFYLTALTEYGFNRTATRDIALNKNDTEKISKIFYTVLASKLIFSLFAFFLLVVLLLVVPLFRQHYVLYLLAFLFVLGQVFIVNWFFQGMEKMQYMAFTALLARLIFVVLVFVFIRDKSDNIFFIFFLGIGSIVAGLLSILFAIRMYHLKFFKPAWHHIKYEIRNGWTFTLTNLSMITCQYIGIIILRIFTNDTLVGYYSIAEKIYFAIKLMLDAFAQVLYPAVCRLIQEERNKVTLYFKQTYVPFFFLVIICCGIVFAFAPQIIHFFVGHRYDYSSFLLRMLCIAAVIVFLNMPAHLILFAANHKRSFLRIFTLGTGLNIVANLVLARYFDATGTVISVLLTEIFITAGVWYEVYRHYYIKKDIKESKLTIQTPLEQLEEPL